MRLIDADALKDELIRESEADTSKSIQTSFAKSVCLLLCKALELQQTVDAVPKEKILLFLNIAIEELSKAHADKSMNGIMTWSASVTTLEGLLKEYGTADTDIVPVIRCKDCRYYEVYERKYDGSADKRFKPSICTRAYEYAVTKAPNWFCADAEPKEAE